jgi:tetratricopeptide (TPR) repeat protein
MDSDVDAAVRQVTAQLEAMRKAQQTPPEDIDTGQLRPLFIPASLCNRTWCGPYYRLRNPDLGMTWCVLIDGGTISYVNHEQQAYWEANGIDWQRLALRNLFERAQNGAGITVLGSKGGEIRAIQFQFPDGLGSSHLWRRGLLIKHFPRGYRVALPDRSYGLAFSAELGPEDLSAMHKIIDAFHAGGSYPLASATYDPDDLLPEKPAEMEMHLAHLGQNPTADSHRVVMDAYRRGDYEEALRQSEGLKLLGEVTAAYCFHRGANLGHLGRLDEAEVWLRRNIGMHEENGRTRLRAIGLTALGQVMLQAARYQDAEECFEKSITLWPERGRGYRYVAELCLLRGGSYTDALRWAECAVSREKACAENPAEVMKLNLGEHLATLAWATAAASHDTTAVALLAGDAIASLDDAVVESTAQVKYQLGLAFAHLGDRETAAQYYGEAARLDRNGHWGRAAKAALESPYSTR